ncbi:hypothetical protein GCM10010275_67130 [Streptomyces litmocidini]|nr:hypothetical protein GCM10010275_67130 [Streptomyces litmocidini]
MRRFVPLFGVSKSAADRIIDRLGPRLALRPRKRFAKGAQLLGIRRSSGVAIRGGGPSHGRGRREVPGAGGATVARAGAGGATVARGRPVAARAGVRSRRAAVHFSRVHG